QTQYLSTLVSVAHLVSASARRRYLMCFPDEREKTSERQKPCPVQARLPEAPRRLVSIFLKRFLGIEPDSSPDQFLRAFCSTVSLNIVGCNLPQIPVNVHMPSDIH